MGNRKGGGGLPRFLWDDRRLLEPPTPAPMPRCPVCGEKLAPEDAVYLRGGAVLGCAFCVRRRDADTLDTETAAGGLLPCR